MTSRCSWLYLLSMAAASVGGSRVPGLAFRTFAFAAGGIGRSAAGAPGRRLALLPPSISGPASRPRAQPALLPSNPVRPLLAQSP